MELQPFTKTAVGLLGLALIACGSAPSASAAIGVVFDDVGPASPHTLSVGSLSLGAADVTPPSAPANLAWSTADLTVTLSWGASTDDLGVVAYELWYGNFYLGGFADTTVALIGFKTGTPYTFTVRARDAAGNVSVASNQVTVLLGIAKDTVPPSAPTNLWASAVSDTRVSLRWTASTDDVGVVLYEVYQGSTLAVTAFGSTSATVSGLTPGASYTFTVRARDAADNASGFSAPVSATTTGAIDYGVIINSIPGLSSAFIKGADVSMLAQLEASGARFYDEAGNPADALRVLRDHGVNWIRLRRWNHPVIAHDFTTDGMTVRAGQTAGGANDTARDALLAKRAKDLGMKVLLDLHYSDWWTDPGKQWVPQAWESLSLSQLQSAIHDDTAATLATMKQAGAMPDMVQLGNETNDGFLWPLGRVSTNGYDGFAALLSRAAAAVREADPSIRIALHLANGGDNALYRSMFTNLSSRGVDFDVIGASYYPYWHGPLSGLQANLNDVSQTFGKPVLVLETAYAWTLDDADSQPNNFGAAHVAAGGYRATVQGQASLLHDVMAVVAGVPNGRGLGVFYWEPDWIAASGAGWYTGGGDAWDNQTLFDHGGKPLPSMNVFRAVSESRPWVEPTIASLPAQTLQTQLGTPASLPSTVTAVYSDDSLRSLGVTWDAISSSRWSTAGTFQVNGTVAGTSLRATLQITVLVNLAQNPGFESGLAGWTLTQSASGVASAASNAGDAHSGSGELKWWSGSAFNFSVQQKVTGLGSGKRYAFTGYVDGQGQATAFASCNGVEQTASVSLAGWGGNGNWLPFTISNLSGAGGSCTVGLRVSGAANDWGDLDDVQLFEQP
jgi:arabinogalactan endo-1,4-beta-galactosidase